MPEYISFTDRLGRKLLMSKDKITYIFDRSDEQRSDYLSEIGFIGDSNCYFYVQESFDEVAKMLGADSIKAFPTYGAPQEPGK